MWYVDFRDKATFDCCQDHFSKILNQCLSLNYGTNSQHKKDKPYMTDALISLIYLLFFRQYNPHFVNDNSSEYDQAINLCRKLQSSEIKSKRANLEVPLNQFFEQLLNGSATQEHVRNMIEID